jgi:hypothetical protein
MTNATFSLALLFSLAAFDPGASSADGGKPHHADPTTGAVNIDVVQP